MNIDDHTFGKLSKSAQEMKLSDRELGESIGRVSAKLEALATVEALLARIADLERPIDMVLHCPECGAQHIDAVTETWPNEPHRTHLCGACGYRWRPADVATNGVAAVKTRGKDDSPIVVPMARPRVPDFEAIKDKSMGELTAEQHDDAQELWLRKQAGWFNESAREHIAFLLRRLDEARGVK